MNRQSAAVESTSNCISTCATREIEDLMGFHLPDAARLDATWWYSDGATLRRFVAAVARVDFASRTAVVNLQAQRVVFDRVSR